jgi:hypothetical protein
VLSAGFEAMASQRLKLMEFSAVDMNSKIGFRSIHVVGEATALFRRQQRIQLPLLTLSFMFSPLFLKSESS